MAKAPRQSELQVVHYLRHDWTFNSNGGYAVGLPQAQVVALLALGYNFATLPPGALILGVDVITDVAFNNGTTNTVSVGLTPTGTDLINAGSIASQAFVTTAAPIAAVTTSKAATSRAGTPLWVSTVQSGTVATTGQASIAVRYIP